MTDQEQIAELRHALRAAADALDKAANGLAIRSQMLEESIPPDEDWRLGEALSARDAARAAANDGRE
jgi:hypothetical protein